MKDFYLLLKLRLCRCLHILLHRIILLRKNCLFSFLHYTHTINVVNVLPRRCPLITGWEFRRVLELILLPHILSYSKFIEVRRNYKFRVESHINGNWLLRSRKLVETIECHRCNAFLILDRKEHL